jgi:branched-chain amino acid transport system ATP-binding protein
MLKLVDVHTYYGDSYILQGVSLEVKEGAVVALLGRNGMGKTTTLRSIIGFTPPRRGTIEFRGEPIIGLSPHIIARKGIGLVPQGRRIFASLSVAENLTMAAATRNKSNPWTLDHVYTLFPSLKRRSTNKGTFLSGGEQQMLAIARALMINPDLLLMDEPSESLAPIIVQEIGKIITGLKQRGYSILLVEQNLGLALAVADYVYILSKGQVAYEGRPEQLEADEQARFKYLGAMA